MKRKLALAILVLLALVAGLSIWVLVPAAADLVAAREVISRPPDKLSARAVEGARTRLERAADRLGSAPGRALGLVPLLGPNVSAVGAVAHSTVPVLDAYLELDRTTDSLGDDLVRDGAVQLDVLERLRRPLRDQARALGELEETLAGRRNGWLLPPLWSDLDGYLHQARGLHRSAARAAEILDVAAPMLGSEGRRTYLVALLNNTELRGAGGILSGIGTITADDGRLRTGSFQHYRELADEPPFRTVPSPEDFRKHFAVYKANTTRWVAASSSPDVPDVAIVARRLFDLVAGVRADGVIFADPRGIAALMPPHSRVEVPGTDEILTRADVPRYVYTKAYEQLGGPTDERREGLIDVGQSAFEDAIDKGVRDLDSLGDVGDAVAGGHLRVVAFEAREERALEHANVTGDLGAPESDGSLVTVQNFGGNKLDFWAERSLRHGCRVRSDGSAQCFSRMRIGNNTPKGLTRYQFQYRPYGLFKNFVEIYVPRTADLSAVEVDGRRARFYPEIEDGYRAVGLYLRIPRGSSTTATVTYSLPPNGDSYALELRPQPLAHDAALRVDISGPRDWVFEGPGSERSLGSMTYEGTLDRELRFAAGPSGRTGIPALWERLARFWRDPVL